MIHKIVTVVLFHLFIIGKVYGNSDSLWNVWTDSQKHDTIRLEALKRCIWESYIYSNPDSAIVLSKLQLKYSKKIDNKTFIASAYNSMGAAYYSQGFQEEASAFFDSAYSYNYLAGNKNKMSSNLCNKALIYHNQSNYKPAIETYFKAIKIFEETKDSVRLGQVYNNMAIIYNEQKFNDLALEYYEKALEIKTALGNKIEIALSSANLAAFYSGVGMQKKAYDLYNMALEININENYKPGMAHVYGNLADLLEIDSIETVRKSGLPYRLKSLKIFKELGDLRNVALQEYGIGTYYFDNNNMSLAQQYLDSSLEKYLQLGIISKAARASHELYRLHSAKKDYRKALSFFEVSQSLEDSVRIMENKEATLKLKFEHDYEKKTIADSISFAKKEEVNLLKLSEQEAQIEKDKIQKYALFGGIGLLLVFGAFAYRTFRRKKRDHDIITLQHQELEESHHEIKQSIDYAKRLQDVFLPSDEELNQYFPDHFLLFKPKDVVSGDFYWFEYDKPTDTKIIAVADCTGHGVPGALVSIVCSSALNKVVKELNIIEPAAILDATRAIVIETFRKTGQDVRDGMDITICSIKNRTVKMAGANNGAWLIKGNERAEITEFKANRQAIGWAEDLKPFTQQQIELIKGDLIYLLTDGFPDQFGGDKGKKLKKKPLKDFIISIHQDSMTNQKRLLDEKFESWRGKIEQIDDVCVVGIRF
ncbi:MAG: tetratricopeptide repeat protein [Crocinitomicaceae bacterium]